VEEYDISLSKPQKTFRIFYVGDSNVQGVVAPEYKMVEIVERQLNKQSEASGIHCEVINTGTSSYSIVTYYLLVKTDLLQYSPDLVVLNIDMTDVVQDYVYRDWIVLQRGDIAGLINRDQLDSTPLIMTPRGVTGGRKRTRIFSWFVRHSAIADYVHRSLFVAEILDAESSKNLDESADWLALNWSDSTAKNVSLSMQTLAKLIELLKSKNIRVMITGVPHLGQYNGMLSTKPFEILQHLAQENQVPYLDTFDQMRRKADEKYERLASFYWTTDGTHYNIEGNRAWAEIQLAFLLDKRNKLLPF
jgi:lysophospholipase L1-like esterase